jgi:choline dehydrogenase-like flavoprotein
MDSRSRQHDFDWLVVGSGFGGSVAALRLSEKGYRVGVLECGRRYEDADFARTAWNLRRYFWAPRIGLRGVFRLTLFKDVFIASGSGVGGGSLGATRTPCTARGRRSFATRSGGSSPTGRTRCARTTTPPSGCSESSTTRA